MTDEKKPYGHTDTAAADGGVVNTNDKGERAAHKNGAGEGVVPDASNGPVFPRPHGVSDDDLRKAGVGQAFAGVGSDEQGDAENAADAQADTEVESPDPSLPPSGTKHVAKHQ